MKFIPELMKEVLETLVKGHAEKFIDRAKSEGMEITKEDVNKFVSLNLETIKEDARKIYPMAYKELSDTIDN